jgi:hypothetical protein
MCFTINHDEKKMKKFLNISLLSLVAFSALTLGSCKNEVDEIFDDDAVARLEKAQKDYYEILTDKGGKWQMEYYANADEPGYIYLMTFNKNGSVTISGENQWIGLIQGKNYGSIGYGSETSLWDVITDNGPVLSFNSFNKFFHLFADPEDIPSTDTEADDETGYGHEGDYEFDLMKYSGDTLYVTGKKYGIEMIMTRVDAGIDDEVYMNEVVAMADSFFNAKIPQVYINLPNGVRYIVKNGASSILRVFREGADEITTAETYNVIITHDGLSFMNPVTLDGYTIKNFIRQADGSLLCRDDHETTMTADPLSSILSNTRLTWRVDLNNIGGVFAGYLPQIAEELTTYNKSKLSYAELTYEQATTSFILTFYVKRGASTVKPKYYISMEPQGDEQIKLNVAAEGDAAGNLYAEKVPSMRAFVDALNASFNLSANSLLAPVNMKTVRSDNAADYLIWNIQ